MTPTPALVNDAAMTGKQLDGLLARIAAMSVDELADIPRAEVRAWPGDPKTPGDRNPRYLRRQRMFADETRVKIEDIAEIAGVGRDAVAKWRTANIKTGATTTKAFLSPIPLTPEQQRRVEAREKRTGKPSRPSPDWYRGKVWEWLDDTDRVDGDLYPPDTGRGGRKPSGRPPEQ